jgi:ATP adenylyltransferase
MTPDETTETGALDGQCDFCREARGISPCTEWAVRVSRTVSRFKWQGTHLDIVPSLGPIVPGHLLVIPRVHVTAMSVASPAALDELDSALERLGHAFLLGNRPLWFEHGSLGAPSAGGCGIEHAHLHMLPTNQDLPCLPATPSGRDWVALGGIGPVEAVRRAGSSKPYLLLGQGEQSWMDKPLAVVSQHMRRELSRVLGAYTRDSWDWRDRSRDSGRIDAHLSLVERLANA